MTGVQTCALPIFTAVISGESQMTFATLPAALPHVKSGRVRAIAIAAAGRSPALPGLATISESGLPGFDVSAWNGILAPRGTARAIVEQINRELRRIVASADVRERAAAQGAELAAGTPEQFAAYLQSQIAKWAKVVRTAGLGAVE